MERQHLRVTVIDMQPITPAVGGGRQRLLGLYHALGLDIQCTYVGTYDWPGEPFRDQQLTPGLREIVAPLSSEHHAAAAELARQMGDRTVIDIAFPDQVHLSPDFLRVAREHLTSADIVVFSHPWCFSPLAEDLRADQLIVYESHNVETLLRTSLLGDLPQAETLLNRIAETEYALCRRADLILACSQEDSDQYVDLMEIDPFKLRIVPNGAFTERFRALPVKSQMQRRRELVLPIDKPIALFLGSMYGPNVEAATSIEKTLARLCPAWHFVIAGGVGEILADETIPNNVTITGRVDDTQRDELLLAAHLALNPMTAGSGTNIKMFDYMAAGLPVLTTDIGARGICTTASASEGMWVEPIDRFPSFCAQLVAQFPFPSKWGESVQKTARQRFSWERISPELGKLLRMSFEHCSGHTRNRPRVALMSTWNVACGIGEHAGFLADALMHGGADVLVLGNKLHNHTPLGFERDMHLAVARAWVWDNVYWQESGIDLERLSNLVKLAKPELLVMQHHTAFVPFDDMVAVLDLARTSGIRVVVEMHNARYVSAEQKEQITSLGVTLLLHHSDETGDVTPAAQANIKVFTHPIHITRSTQRKEKRARPNNELKIGGFGFLRPYKGLLTTIHTIALLRREYQDTRYFGWHAVYPGDSSEDYLRLCMRQAEMLGVRDAIEIDTRFLNIDEVIENLRGIDVALMPYEPSDEGASGAANIALASTTPVVTSPSAIFRSLSDVVYIAPHHTPEAYATAINQIAVDEKLAETLRRKSAAWAAEHSYDRAAIELLRGFSQSFSA